MTTWVERTHVGFQSAVNEDASGGNPATGLWFLADGMGGHVGGKMASGIVRDSLLASAADADLRDVVLAAHSAVLAGAAEHEEYRGMGSTLVAVRLADRLCRVVWAGDSRAYLWRQGELTPLTRDHSVIESLRQQGQFSETELESHPRRHQITQCLGKGTPDPSSREVPLRKGDRILLCSDGLHDDVSDAEIGTLLSQNTPLDAAADALIAAALDKGGHDNVTVLLVEYDGRSAIRRAFSPRAKQLLPVVGGVIAAAIVATVWWYLTRT